MTKEEFVAQVAKTAALQPSQVRAVLRGVEEVAAAALRTSSAVRIPGLVWLRLVPRGERIVRNPASQEEYCMGATVMVKAKPVTSLAQRVKAENAVAEVS